MIHVYNNGRSRTARKLQALLDDAEGSGTVNWTGIPLDSDIDIVLNGASRTNKLAQLARLELKEVNIPPWGFNRLDNSWYPRTLNHQQGFDFTEGPVRADFWVKKLDFAEEWRLHFFRTTKGNTKLLRSGIKVPRLRVYHPWVRSHRLGWKISYTGGAPEEAVTQGRRALQALNLDFGAIDVGVLNTRPWAVVLEVNTCPGLDTGTLKLYAEAVKARLA